VPPSANASHRVSQALLGRPYQHEDLRRVGNAPISIRPLAAWLVAQNTANAATNTAIRICILTVFVIAAETVAMPLLALVNAAKQLILGRIKRLSRGCEMRR